MSLRGVRKAKDCVRNERIIMDFSDSISESWLGRFRDHAQFKVETYDASRYLPDAKIIFNVRSHDDLVLATGALGLNYMTVAFDKTGPVEEWRRLIMDLVK